jgi:hypothetical protein
MPTKLDALRALYDRAANLHDEMTEVLDDLADALGIDDDDDGSPPAAETDVPCPCARPVAPLAPREVWALWPVVPHDAAGRALYGTRGELFLIPMELVS